MEHHVVEYGKLPSPAALDLANRNIQTEILADKEILASLDRQVRERTADLEQATTALAVQAREAIHHGPSAARTSNSSGTNTEVPKGGKRMKSPALARR